MNELLMSNVVAAVQYAPSLGDVRANMATAQQLAFEAAARGARIVVLPELCFSGMNFEGPQEASSAAQAWDGYQTKCLEPIAKKFNCHIVMGYLEAVDGNLFNSAVAIGPSGPLKNFQKHNLWGAENLYAQASELPFGSVIVPNIGRLGVLICRDIKNNYRESYAFHNSNYRFYRSGSVDVIALLTNWGMSYAYPDSSWVELVESTGANVIVSNRVGKEKDITFKGGSAIIDRQRRIWTHGSNFDREAIVGGIVV
jgi:N-carbamoylputrescine amidase